MTLPSFLAEDKYGWVHVRGHRIGLQDLVHFHDRGETIDMLANRFPSMSPSLVGKVIGFYLENQVEVAEYVKSCNEEVERQRAAAKNG